MKTVQIDVRELSWDMHIMSYDEHGNKITVSTNKDTMDPEIYVIGWVEAAIRMVEDGFQVTVNYFES